MKRYKVIFESSAYSELDDSYVWGRRVWGVDQANNWAREIRRACLTGLASLPERCPIAPESTEFDEMIRQMIVGRYRILFAIRGKKVHILHVRGASSETVEDES